MTRCILAETLRQRGNGVVTNRLIRIFGDDQHMGRNSGYLLKGNGSGSDDDTGS
jgi:hypothetical protein